MSQRNVEIVQAIYEEWSRGDYSRVDWADAEIEFSAPGGFTDEPVHGLEAMRHEWVDGWLKDFESFASHATEFIEVGDDEVMARGHFSGRGRGSGVPIEEMQGATRFVFRDGKVVKLAIYTDLERAFEDAGISR